MPKTPTEEEVLAYFTSCRNWGRWGPNDQLGTLNLITAAKRLEAARAIVDGKSVGCARPILFEQSASDVTVPPLHFMTATGESQDSAGGGDFIGFTFHGRTITHIDALAHRIWKRQMYNGYPAEQISIDGAKVCGVETMRGGILTRGVLLDVTRVRNRPYLDVSEPVHAEDLDAAEQLENVHVSPGDALLVRTGWSRRRFELGPYPVAAHRPGLHASTLPWLKDRDVAIVAADAPNDVIPSGYPNVPYPIHDVGIVAMGLCLIDNCQFEDLAKECEAATRWEFAFVAAPLNFPTATGSPITPIAIL